MSTTILTPWRENSQSANKASINENTVHVGYILNHNLLYICMEQEIYTKILIWDHRNEYFVCVNEIPNENNVQLI